MSVPDFAGNLHSRRNSLSRIANPRSIQAGQNKKENRHHQAGNASDKKNTVHLDSQVGLKG
jgi:hypothetical protein